MQTEWKGGKSSEETELSSRIGGITLTGGRLLSTGLFDNTLINITRTVLFFNSKALQDGAFHGHRPFGQRPFPGWRLTFRSQHESAPAVLVCFCKSNPLQHHTW